AFANARRREQIAGSIPAPLWKRLLPEPRLSRKEPLDGVVLVVLHPLRYELGDADVHGRNPDGAIYELAVDLCPELGGPCWVIKFKGRSTTHLGVEARIAEVMLPVVSPVTPKQLWQVRGRRGVVRDPVPVDG